jgi:hypothetical protein
MQPVNFLKPVPGSGQSLTSTATSSAMANAFGAQTKFVRVIASAAINIRIDTGTPVATASDTLLAANVPEIFAVGGNWKLAAIGAGTVNVTEMTS